MSGGFGNFAQLASNVKNIGDGIKAKAQDALANASQVQQRVTQQALEAAGIADKSDDDDLPELKTHLMVDSQLKKVYKRADQYLRAMSSMCECSRLLADDMAQACESLPELRGTAAKFASTNHEALTQQLQLLGQLMHLKVFKPIRREVEGRKDIEKRLSDRKKVRLDYDAYRRKQITLKQQDPANGRMYDNNLENARQTFARHSTIVAKELADVAKERDTTLSEAFMALLASQVEFFATANSTLSVMKEASVSAFSASSPQTASSWRTLLSEQKQMKESLALQAKRQAEAKAADAAAQPMSPTSQQIPRGSAANHQSLPNQASGATQSPQPKSEYVPPNLGPMGGAAQGVSSPVARGGGAPGSNGRGGAGGTIPRVASAPVGPTASNDLLGLGGGGGASEVDLLAGVTAVPPTPPPAAPPAASEDFDLLGGGVAAPSSAAPTFDAQFDAFPDGGGGADLLHGGEADLLNGGGGGGGPPASAGDLMGGDLMGGGGNEMDDLFSLTAPSPLMPSAGPAPTRVSSSSNLSAPSCSMDPMGMGGGMGGSMGGGDLMAGWGAAPSPSAAAPSRARSATVPVSPMNDMMGDMMGGGMGGGGGGGDLMGGDFDPFGMGGGGMGGGAVEVQQEAGESDRAFFQRRRESQKSAAIAEKVQRLKEQKETEESNREAERDMEKQVKAKVQAWQREKKNIRALLASLHEIAPPCAWQPVGLDKLLQPNDVKRSYRKAMLAVHPDKQSAEDIEAKVRAQLVFDALRDAWNLFESQNK